MTVMMAEDRAAIVAWRLFCQNVSIEWFQEQLVSQSKPAWNRAVGIIADAIFVRSMRRSGAHPGSLLCHSWEVEPSRW
jgi:hypothetical protein